MNRLNMNAPPLNPPWVLRAGPRLERNSQVPASLWAVLLTLIPVLDPVLNQIHTAVPLRIGPFSLLQVLRGALLLALLAYAILAGQRNGRENPTGWVCLMVAGCLAAFGLNEFYRRGELPLESSVAGAQMLYWALAWHVAAQAIRSRGEASLVAGGLVAGSLVTAASVIYAYLAGVPSFYRTQGVDASAGWFASAKGIAGTLAVGAVLAGHLAWQRRRPVYWWAAALCVGALLLTYARAGMVAACCALAWLLIWAGANGFGRRSAWARRMLLTSAIAGAIFFLQAGTEGLLRRWSDLEQPGYAGSGRLILWSAAWDRYLEGTATEQVFGIGYGGMLDLTERAAGARLHTHNDVLDLLLVGGMVGIVFLMAVLAGIVWQIRRVPFRAPEFALAVAVLTVLLVQGGLTGQIFLPDVMAYYLLAISAIATLGAGPQSGFHALRPARSGSGTGGGA